MKTIVCIKTGKVILVPESNRDTSLILHLLNCSDLSQFSEYLELEQQRNYQEITTDLDVPVPIIDKYPIWSSRRAEDDTSPVNRSTGKNGKSGLCNDLERFTSEPGYLLNCDRKRSLIGFNRP